MLQVFLFLITSCNDDNSGPTTTVIVNGTILFDNEYVDGYFTGDCGSETRTFF